MFFNCHVIFILCSGYLKFWHAILIDLGSLLIVVLNGTRLLRYRVFESTNAATVGGGTALPQKSNGTAGGSTYNPIQQV